MHRGTVDVDTSGGNPGAKGNLFPGQPSPQGGYVSDVDAEGFGGDGAESVSSLGADRAIATPWEPTASGAGFHLTTTMHHVVLLPPPPPPPPPTPPGSSPGASHIAAIRRLQGVIVCSGSSTQ